MLKPYFFAVLMLLTVSVSAQEPITEYTIGENIKTVKINLQGLPLSLPLLELTNSAKIELSWDDLDADLKQYYYKIIYCNADWTPNTMLTEMDYISGYSYDQVRDFRTSSRSLTNYIHYSLTVPNENTKFLKSGNYILKIYTDNDEENVVMTRRFMILEPKIRLMAQMQIPGGARSRTHQELDFTVDHKGYTIRNPQNEVKTVVMQNARWDNAITDLMPVFQRESQLVYDFQDRVVFLAGKEYRRLDLTTTRYQTEGVDYYESTNKSFDGYGFRGIPLRDVAYQWMADANGKFVTLSKDTDAASFQADYVNMHFSLPLAGEVNGASVYVFGGHNNFVCDEYNKMHYNTMTHQYEATILMKQGFYNYLFAVVRDGDKTPNLSRLEGDWYETENDYTILVYHRPFGARYDMLIGAQTLNSVR